MLANFMTDFIILSHHRLEGFMASIIGVGMTWVALGAFRDMGCFREGERRSALVALSGYSSAWVELLNQLPCFSEQGDS